VDVHDLWRLDATAQAALVRAGDVTPAQLVEAAIARIERLNPHINAVITPLYDDARREGRDGAAFDGPFAGVPLLLKDACIEVEGTPYALGTSVLRDIGHRSRQTTELARRFRRTGFIFVGKTNTPELSAGITTEPPAFGPTRNPWDLTRTAGGSSGGSAAAVAAGMTSIAHGGDATGSLRYPAACCGVVTLKPSRGRMPHVTPAGQPDVARVWAEFVLARSVRDLAAVLDAVGGPAAGDAFAAPPPDRPYALEIGAPPGRLRVGIMTKDVMAGIPTDAECAAAVERTGALLASLGHEVEDAHPPALDGLLLRTAGAIALLAGSARLAQLRWLEKVAGRALTAADLDAESMPPPGAGRITDAQIAEAAEVVKRETGAVEAWWASGYDLLVTPVLRQPPWPLGQHGGAMDAGVFPAPFSFTGQPAMSLPLHWTPAGLPVGVQLVAAYGREDLLLRVAAQLESARSWADRWPAIAGTGEVDR
jgi:amidase